MPSIDLWWVEYRWIIQMNGWLKNRWKECTAWSLNCLYIYIYTLCRPRIFGNMRAMPNFHFLFFFTPSYILITFSNFLIWQSGRNEIYLLKVKNSGYSLHLLKTFNSHVSSEGSFYLKLHWYPIYKLKFSISIVKFP